MATPIVAVEGEIPFDAPGAGKPCTTWYKLIGDMHASPHPPLIALHGGPGAGHDYLSPLAGLHRLYGVPIVLYDQVGCGRSTHLRERAGDADFWTFDLFVAQLDGLVDHLGLRGEEEGKGGFSVFGQSWGAMLAGMYAARRPAGLRKVVISSGPISFPLFVRGVARMRAGLPADVQEVLARGDEDEAFREESDDYKAATRLFYKTHVCRVDPMPEDVKATFGNLKDDPTAYNTMQGPSEVLVTGSLKDWDGTEEARKIEVEALVTNGKYDEVGDESVEPWARVIKNAKRVVFENSSHMAHWEETDRFLEVIGGFLTGKE